MTLRYTISKDDYFHFCMYGYDHSDAVKKQAAAVRLLYGCVLVLLTAAVFLRPITDHPLIAAAILWAVSAVLFATTKRGVRKSTARQYRRQIDAGKGAEFIGDYTLELLEDVLVLTQPSKVSKMGYDVIERVGQGEHGLYVYCGSMSAIPVPLTAFEDESRRAGFLALLEARCGALPRAEAR